MRKLKFQLDRKSLEINYKLSSFDRYKNIVMKYGITVRKIKKMTSKKNHIEAARIATRTKLVSTENLYSEIGWEKLGTI